MEDVTTEQVTAAIEANRALIDALTEAQTEAQLAGRPITPEWSGLDILRHMMVWNELCTRCLEDWTGSRDWALTFANEDQFNLEMVAARQDLSLDEILEGIETAYAAYERALIDCTPEELAYTAPAPWGAPMTPLQMIMDELHHDRMHLHELG